MVQKTMFKTIVGNKQTSLTQSFVAGRDTVVYVADTSFLPEGPNTATICKPDQLYLVTVKYTGKTSSSLTGISIVQGTPSEALTSTFDTTCKLSKPLTQDDIQTIQDNIVDLNSSMKQIFYGETEPTDARIGDLWCTDGGGSSDRVNFTQIDGSPYSCPTLELALNAKNRCFYSSTEPSNPIEGDLWCDDTPTNDSPVNVGWDDITGTAPGAHLGNYLTDNYYNKTDVATKISNHNDNDGAHSGLFAKKLDATLTGGSNKILMTGDSGQVILKDVDTLTSQTLSTENKNLVGVINSLVSTVYTLNSAVEVKVVDAYPSSPGPNTIYYVKDTGTSRYNIYLCTLSSDPEPTPVMTSLGSTEIDLSSYLKNSSVIDNLLSTITDKPLSANQGKVLDGKKVDKNQGTENAGKVLVVASDGTVALSNIVPSVAWGTITGTITSQTDLKEALDAKLGTEYTASQDGWIAKVDSADHKLKVMNSTAGVSRFSELDGYPTDNVKLKRELDAKVSITSIVDNLTSDSTTEPLSAKQGKALNGYITSHSQKTNNPHRTSIDLLTDVDHSEPLATGNILIYDGSKWVPSSYIDDSNDPSYYNVWSSKHTQNVISSTNRSKVFVVAERPEEPSRGAIYYVGPVLDSEGNIDYYNIWIYALKTETEYDWYYMGKTKEDISNCIKFDDIEDSLTSTSAIKVLSAKQGSILNAQKARIYYSETEPVGIQEGEFWATEDGVDESPMYANTIKMSSTSDVTITDAIGKKEDSEGLELKIYNLIYPKNSIRIQYTANDNPNTLLPQSLKSSVTWTDVTNNYNLRYFAAYKDVAAGTTYNEELPNIKGSVNQLIFKGGFGGSGALSAANYAGMNCDGTNWGAGGVINFNASSSNSTYKDGGAVRPLTYTIKVWCRTK